MGGVATVAPVTKVARLEKDKKLGFALVDPDGNRESAAEHFSSEFFWDEAVGQAILINKNSGDVEAYEAWASMHTEHRVAFDKLGQTVSDSVVYRLLHPIGGCALYWGLGGLHEALGLPGTPNAWYHKHFAQWRSWLRKACRLPAVHLRRGQDRSL